MRARIYCLFIFLVFLSINGNARTDDAPTLWKDLGEITRPMVFHETYDTRYAANRYGNSKNDVFFTFVVYRTTIFTSNFNGSPLEDINAHLLYSPLDADKYTNVGEPIPVDYEKFTEKSKLLTGWNLSLEEKIHHGWTGTLFIQILKPGKYVFHCEAGQNCNNGYIRSNIYINPVGTSAEQPKIIGTYEKNFDSKYSATFAEQPSGTFYSLMALNRAMEIHISSKGTKKNGAVGIRIKDQASGRIMADSKNFPNEDGTYPQIGNVRLNTGIYIVEVTYTGKTELYMNVTGALSGYLPGDLRENSILIPTVSDETDYQKTFDTRDYTDQYNEKPTKDIFHRLEVKEAMDLLITCPHCEIEGGATVTVMNGSHKEGVLDTNTEDRLELPGLKAGTYYIISEGNTNDGSMTLRVQGNPKHWYGPSTERNYIKTIVPTISAPTPILLNNPYKAQQKIDYYDFLGRPEQTVNYGASVYLNDLVSYIEYDGLGRKSRSWLPIISPISGAYANPQDIKLYSSIYYRDSCTYEKSIYEASPLNRIVESYGAGKEWQLSGHSVKSGYRCNTPADSCKYFVVEGARFSPDLHLRGMYPASRLAVITAEDEDGHIGYSFTDKKGHVVLERKMAENGMLDTYYVYDDYGNLCFVLPPVAADSFVETGKVTDTLQSILDKYAYQYVYDYRNRCIFKKLPGCEPVEQIYDCNDRLPFTQDGEQRKRNEWNVSLTDLLGRTVITGIYKGTIDRDECTSINIATLFAPDDADAYNGYLISLPDNFILDKLDVSQVNFYDTYEMIEGINDLDYREDEIYGKRYVNAQEASQHCKGLLTGSITRILDSEEAVFSAYYYDYHQNRIQERHISTITGKDMTIKALFNFSGNPTATCEEYNGGEVKLRKSYVYDQAGKVKEEVHILNGQDSTRFVYEYNLSGNLSAIKRISGDESLYTSNTYNIRNWLTSTSNRIFKETLHYIDGTGTPCYNGNISSMTWRTDTISRGYTFSYDKLSRLKNAMYGEGSSLSENLNRFDEQVTGYDKMGNILGLKRYGQTAPSVYGLIDDLSLSYNGNQLQAVNDNSVNSVYANGFEFKDGAKQDTEYFYDSNGNLIKDLNKKITDIQYNSLNLPARIQFEGGNSISYLYGADGSKLRTTHVIDGDTLVTDYLGSAIYENGVLTKLMTEQGYFTLSDTIYHYFLQDHQGNNRVVVDQNGTVEEVNHYYPFGGVFASTSSVQPYKYNGKELDRKGGLDWYDYGARHYDAALGRWHVTDPLGESYYPESAYCYCGNNPVNRVDLFGMDYWSTSDPNEIARFMDALRFNSSSIAENFNFDSWTHVTDDEFTGNLTFNDETNTFYTSYGTVENGVPTSVGISIKASNTWDGGASIDGGRGRWYRKASGRLENKYPEFGILVLARSLTNLLYKGVQELPTQIHHFATNKNSKYTQDMLAIAQKYGLKLDEAWNKAALPHLGRHPNAYHEFVLENMQRASREAGGSTQQFLKLFDKYVKQKVINNPNLLNKSGWQ